MEPRPHSIVRLETRRRYIEYALERFPSEIHWAQMRVIKRPMRAEPYDKIVGDDTAEYIVAKLKCNGARRLTFDDRLALAQDVAHPHGKLLAERHDYFTWSSERWRIGLVLGGVAASKLCVRSDSIRRMVSFSMSLRMDALCLKA